MLDFLGSAICFLGTVGGTVPARLLDFLRCGLLPLELLQRLAAGALLDPILRHPLGVFPRFVREPVRTSHQRRQHRINNESRHRGFPHGSSTSNTSRHAQGDETANSSTSHGTTNQPHTGTSCDRPMPTAADPAGSAAQSIAVR